jgi:hypothetical protein
MLELCRRSFFPYDRYDLPSRHYIEPNPNSNLDYVEEEDYLWK